MERWVWPAIKVILAHAALVALLYATWSLGQLLGV
jgi:hypothetical protein